MPDIETVARRLLSFACAADLNAKGHGQQTGPRHMQAGPGKSREQQAYEKCVALLDDAERAALDQLISKMMSAARLPSPPGAIVPP
jgi:hypothetical protein